MDDLTNQLLGFLKNGSSLDEVAAKLSDQLNAANALLQKEKESEAHNRAVVRAAKVCAAKALVEDLLIFFSYYPEQFNIDLTENEIIDIAETIVNTVDEFMGNDNTFVSSPREKKSAANDDTEESMNKIESFLNKYVR